jgi:uncharacterized glyoxalase superfamily protein PhnB
MILYVVAGFSPRRRHCNIVETRAEARDYIQIILRGGHVMNETSTFKPQGWPTVVPRIVVPEARELVAFIKHVFEATGEYQPDRPAVLSIGDSILMVSEAGIRDAAHAFLYVYVPDADATFRRAIAAGTRSLEEPSDQPYGDRRGMVEDKWGNIWQIATYLKNAD